MITLRRLDLVRQDSIATAEELANLQTQLNALPFTQFTAKVGPTTAPATPPAGMMEIVIHGVTYVMPFYAKA